MKQIFVYIFCISTMLLVWGCENGQKQGATYTAQLTEAPMPQIPDTFHLGNMVVKAEIIDSVLYYGVPDMFQLDSSEAVALAKDSALVMRNGDSLIFRTEGEKVVYLINYSSDTDEFNFADFRYMGHIAGQYVVAAGFFEAEDHLLIDDQTGDTTYILGQPVVSPDHSMIFGCGHGVDGDGRLALFECFSATHKPVLKGSKMIDDIWVPEEIKWLNNNTLVAKGWTSWMAVNNVYKSCTIYYQFTVNKESGTISAATQ